MSRCPPSPNLTGNIGAVHLIDPTRRQIRPLRHDLTGEVVGFNTDHWSGRSDGLVRPPVARPLGVMRQAIAEACRPRSAVDFYREQAAAITASGVFIATFDNAVGGGLSINLATDTINGALLDTAPEPTPDFEANTLWSALSGSEHPATGGYTAGGEALAGFAASIGTVGTGTWEFDATDHAYGTGYTLTDVMAQVWIDDTPAGDPMLFLFDFVTAVSVVSGTLTVQYGAPAVSIDLTP